MSGGNRDELLNCTTQIIAAHVARSPTLADALPTLIASVYQALAGAGTPATEIPERPEPAVAIKRSVFPDHLICLEDGKSFKTLRRHLQKVYGMTPDQYRQRWGLPRDYPMVAPAYAEHRSKLAKSFGLGRKAGAEVADQGGAVEEVPQETVEGVAVKKIRARRAIGSHG